MDEQGYWIKKHDKYAATDWIDKPSLFAEWAIQYFPAQGALLDLGAGQAQDSRYFASKGYEVTATDFSEYAIKLAKQKSSADIAFAVVDLAQPLPYEDSSFDIVYTHLSLHYFDTSTTEKLFAEIRRVLKPGGILAALNNSAEDPELAEGAKIEEHFVEHEGINKRFFSVDDARNFAKDFEIIIADDAGTTYKDEAKGVHNLIRLIAKKAA